jgi:hypothetical protein
MPVFSNPHPVIPSAQITGTFITDTSSNGRWVTAVPGRRVRAGSMCCVVGSERLEIIVGVGRDDG